MITCTGTEIEMKKTCSWYETDDKHHISEIILTQHGFAVSLTGYNKHKQKIWKP